MNGKAFSAKSIAKGKGEREESVRNLDLCYSKCDLWTSARPQTITDPQQGAYIKMEITSVTEPSVQLTFLGLVGSKAFLMREALSYILEQAPYFVMDL